MPYIKRDAQGAIVAVSRVRESEDWTEVPADFPELLAFNESLTASDTRLATSDLALARVLEDLVDLLVDKSVIRFTDLPEAAQKKLTERRSVRASMLKLNLLDSDNDVI